MPKGLGSSKKRCANDVGGKFAGNKTFIDELERAVVCFYGEFGQKLKSRQPSPPKMARDPAQVPYHLPSSELSAP